MLEPCAPDDVVETYFLLDGYFEAFEVFPLGRGRTRAVCGLDVLNEVLEALVGLEVLVGRRVRYFIVARVGTCDRALELLKIDKLKNINIRHE